jgi:hypothetical protein
MPRFIERVETKSYKEFKELTNTLFNNVGSGVIIALLENFIVLHKEERKRKEKNDPRFKSWKHKKACFGFELCWAYNLIMYTQTNSA